MAISAQDVLEEELLPEGPKPEGMSPPDLEKPEGMSPPDLEKPEGMSPPGWKEDVLLDSDGLLSEAESEELPRELLPEPPPKPPPPKPPLPPMEPMAETLRSEASTRAELSVRWPAVVEGMVPSSCPRMLSPRRVQ